MSEKYVLPKSRFLTVIIRDNSPFIFMQEPPTHRSVTIELTDEQLNSLKLNYIGVSCGQEYYESISKAFLETGKEESCSL